MMLYILSNKMVLSVGKNYKSSSGLVYVVVYCAKFDYIRLLCGAGTFACQLESTYAISLGCLIYFQQCVSSYSS